MKFNLHSFSRKKLILLGFIVVLLFAIPLTVFVVQQQQVTKSNATPNTTLSLTPLNQTVNSGDVAHVDLTVIPGSNQVSFVKFVATYDPTKVKPADTAFDINQASQMQILQTPTSGTNTVSVTLSIGSSFQNAISAPTKVGTLNFVTLDSPGTTTINIDRTQSEVRSLGTGDTFVENVLQNSTPANIIINAAATPTPTPTPTPTATPTATPTPTPLPTAIPSSPPATTSAAPVCQSLSLDRSASGTAPYQLTFTATGNDSDSNISKVTFDFGDGNSQDVTAGGNLGTPAINAQSAHTYANPGTFTATAILTDANGITSNSSTCTQAITVAAAVSQTPVPTVIANPSPLPATGPDKTILGVGALGAVLSVLGIVLFLAI